MVQKEFNPLPFLMFGGGVFLIFIYIGCLLWNTYRKSKLVGEITQTPIIPWSQDEMYEVQMKPMPNAKIYCPHIPNVKRNAYYTFKKISSILRTVFDVDRFELPLETHLVSIKMENFKHGLKCHDFEPIDGRAPGSYYTYQMFGDNRIQATNYVENDISYVAGFCIYIEDGCQNSSSYRKEIIKDLVNSLKYPEKNLGKRNKTTISSFCNKKIIENQKESKKESEENVWLFEEDNSPSKNLPSTSNFIEFSQDDTHTNETLEWTVKHCQKLRRMVMSRLEPGKVIHQEWNSSRDEMNSGSCQVCLEQMEQEHPPTYSSFSID